MNVSTSASGANARQCWAATLDPDFDAKERRTRLASLRHQGPLRAQRPFQPDADGAHLAWLTLQFLA